MRTAVALTPAHIHARRLAVSVALSLGATRWCLGSSKVDKLYAWPRSDDAMFGSQVRSVYNIFQPEVERICGGTPVSVSAKRTNIEVTLTLQSHMGHHYRDDSSKFVASLLITIPMGDGDVRCDSLL
jgi:hypothetical protein